NGLRMTAVHAVPQDTDPETVDAFSAAFAADYSVNSNVRTRPYEGIPELLEELKERGVRLAVVSNKADAVVKELVAFHFPGAFEAVAGESPTVRRKPAPDSTDRVLELLGIAKEGACYIGDSEVDVLTAANAGLDCISCTWGFRDEPELVEAGASRIVHTMDELLEAVIG
ncbi:MAG: HAD family hydrolase, partial [Atopobiaceae bacterium]|nr:HAD family hydrolase [Atopobiaceae bacterium]